MILSNARIETFIRAQEDHAWLARSKRPQTSVQVGRSLMAKSMAALMRELLEWRTNGKAEPAEIEEQP